MELRSKSSYILLGFAFMLIMHKINAQVEISAKLKGGNLKVEFCNKSDKTIKVPDLSVRYGVNKTHLFENYYTILNDTLRLTLREELDSDLYTIRSREQNDGKTNASLRYIDKVLLPGKNYRSKIRLKETNDISFLILHYEGLKLESIINK